MRLISIQVGQPRRMGTEGAEDPLDRPWTSAIWKDPVAGRVWATATGLVGDAQADRRHHGGPDKALLAYAAAHYPRWEADLGLPRMAPGGFGENLTVEGLAEPTVCVGDVFRIGGCRVQVSQPRQPCSNLARRFRVRDMVKRVQEADRYGWYLRVVKEGWLEAGDAVVLEDRPYPHWTVIEATRTMVERRADPERARRLADCAALSTDWKAALSGVEA